MNHGTMKGVWRHNNRKEPLCEACLPLWVQYLKDHPRKGARVPTSGNRYTDAYEQAIAANPPRIVWRMKPNGIRVAVSVHDPHMETKAQREWDERMASEEAALAAMEQQAREVAARFERHRADNTSLMNAARRSI